VIRGLLALALVPMLSAAAPLEDYAEPYRILQQANRTLDPVLAASAYRSDGVLIFDYPGRPPEEFRGREAIRASYARTFRQFELGTPIELEFRFEPPGPHPKRHSGAYRVKARASGRDITAYGRFTVRLVKEHGHWRFLEDRGTAATAADFERLCGAGQCAGREGHSVAGRYRIHRSRGLAAART